MHLEEFAEGNSFLHKIDPRVKLVAFMPYSLIIALMHGISGPLTGLVFATLMIIFSGIDFRKVLSRLIVVNIFIFMLWLFLPFSYPGEAVFRIGSLAASREGFLYALSITLKANAIVLITIAILGTSGIFSLAHALVHLKMPDKAVHLFFFFYRYISVLHEEYTRLKNAMAIRCFQARTNIHTYKMYAYFVGMLIVRSYDRSQRIYRAMLCRGFKGRLHIMNHFKLRNKDLAFGFLMLLMTLITGLFGEY